jgi:hypothetical protein
MKPSRTLITVAGTATATAAIAIALATTGSAAASTLGSGTFTVRAHHGSETNVDLGPKGFSAGDEDLTVSPLTAKGHQVGRLVGNCTTARAGRTSVDELCEFVLRIGTSQLTAAGTVRAGQRGPGTFTLPILGGTGRYRGAGGTIAVSAGNGSTIPITVSLDR